MILENQKTNQIDFPHYKEHFITRINNGDFKFLKNFEKFENYVDQILKYQENRLQFQSKFYRLKPFRVEGRVT